MHSAPVFSFLFASGGTVDLTVAMLVVFGAAKLLEELLERLGLPGIVGQILAGVVIGPSVLGWITPNELTGTLAELGVMFLLFQVGLEVHSDDLLRTGVASLVVGFLGVALPTAAGWAFYRLWGRDNLESVFLGTAICATSVGITAQVLSARGLLDRTASRIILGAAVVDDILALLLLGYVTSLAAGPVNVGQLVATSCVALGFVFVVTLWGSRAVSHVAARIEPKLRAGEAQFGMAMLLMFGLAAASSKIGIAAIIGAFLAGMALSQYAAKRVHDMTHGVAGLLVPFFLAGIGLHLDLGVFRNLTTIVIALTFVPVPILAKFLACSVGASRYGLDVAKQVGAGMVPLGEFCMLIAQTGLSTNAIQPDTYSIIVFGAVTAASAGPSLVKWAFKAEQTKAEVEVA
jgi:Kef-type K+ transport system membrane component KefB